MESQMCRHRMSVRVMSGTVWPTEQYTHVQKHFTMCAVVMRDPVCYWDGWFFIEGLEKTIIMGILLYSPQQDADNPIFHSVLPPNTTPSQHRCTFPSILQKRTKEDNFISIYICSEIISTGFRCSGPRAASSFSCWSLSVPSRNYTLGHHQKGRESR